MNTRPPKARKEKCSEGAGWKHHMYTVGSVRRLCSWDLPPTRTSRRMAHNGTHGQQGGREQHPKCRVGQALEGYKVQESAKCMLRDITKDRRLHNLHIERIPQGGSECKCCCRAKGTARRSSASSAKGGASLRRARRSASFWAMSGTKGCSEAAWRQTVACVREYLNHLVQEIPRADRLNPFNHCPHFPFFMTHFTDPMPISSIGGIWSADLWNSKHASHFFKVTVAVDMLG